MFCGSRRGENTLMSFMYKMYVNRLARTQNRDIARVICSQGYAERYAAKRKARGELAELIGAGLVHIDEHECVVLTDRFFDFVENQ